MPLSILRKKKRRMKIPVIGIEGAGKTLFLVTLAYHISYNNWGRVDKTVLPYVNSIMEKILKGEVPSSTRGRVPVSLRISRIKSPGGVEYRFPEEIEINTYDLSGVELRRASSEIAASFTQGPSVISDSTWSLLRILEDADALIAIIDIVRGKTRVTEKDIAIAFGDQINPITHLVLYATMHRRGGILPVFFVFSKADIHGLDSQTLSRYFYTAWAITIRSIMSLGALFYRVYSYSAIIPREGGISTILSYKGVGDLIYSVISATMQIKGIYGEKLSTIPGGMLGGLSRGTASRLIESGYADYVEKAGLGRYLVSIKKNAKPGTHAVPGKNKALMVLEKVSMDYDNHVAMIIERLKEIIFRKQVGKGAIKGYLKAVAKYLEDLSKIHNDVELMKYKEYIEKWIRIWGTHRELIELLDEIYYYIKERYAS